MVDDLKKKAKKEDLDDSQEDGLIIAIYIFSIFYF